MGRQHVDHGDIMQFAQDSVNLHKDKERIYRQQASQLREKVDAYMSESPDFALKKVLISGSLAKGTALSSLNDIDLAFYVSGADTPRDVNALLDYLAEHLRHAYPNFHPDQISRQTYSVTVAFRGTGLDVDVVPIIYDGDPDWYGNLVSQDDGSFLETCIPRHLDFIDARKKNEDFTQVVRLVKFWAHGIKNERPGFRFKSFMIELILARICDQGLDLSDYPEALQHFFTYVAQTRMRKKIVFEDYPAPEVQFSDPVQIIDPVNPDNNVARLYTADHADAITEAALRAGDAIDAALAAPTKQETVRYWRKVFGASFRPDVRVTAQSLSNAGASTSTKANAVHIAAKIATDIKRMQRFYGAPSDERLQNFETEAIELFKAGYVDRVFYGFKRDGYWIEPTLSYTARDLHGDAAGDDDPGRIRPGAPTNGAPFHSYLSLNSAWQRLTLDQRNEFNARLPFQRCNAPEPGTGGSWIADSAYSSGLRAADRATLRSATR